MYMGVILCCLTKLKWESGIPHVYGGDPVTWNVKHKAAWVFPMYMGVIPLGGKIWKNKLCIPHVYGGDPPRLRS